MGAIRVHEFMSLDGVVGDPRWTMPFGFDPKMGETIAAVMGNCTAILLGRTTYEMFAPAWSTRTAEDDPGAPFMNETTKYVVTSAGTDVEWRNTQLVGRYDPEVIRRLKVETDGDLYVSGSVTLVRALLQDGLVDNLHLLVYPTVIGKGLRLFSDDSALTLRLAGSDTYSNGVVHLDYAPATDTA